MALMKRTRLLDGRHFKTKKKTKRTKLEQTLYEQLRAFDLPFEEEVMWCPGRMFPSDFGINDGGEMMLIEAEGGTYTHARIVNPKTGKLMISRHLSPTGFHDDCEKYTLATIYGFRLLRFDAKQIADGFAIKAICTIYYDLHHTDNPMSLEMGRRLTKMLRTYPDILDIYEPEPAA